MAGSRQRRDWEELSALDPYWAILSDSQRRFGGWDADSFAHNGVEAVALVIADGARFSLPRERRTALDFGCGAGRLTLVLAREFEQCLGLDISELMVAEARQRAAATGVANCTFDVHDGATLAGIGGDSFDLVVSRLVLQHVASAEAKARYIAELVRVLRPGGLLALQLPSRMPPLRRLQPRPRAYGLLRHIGVPPATLYYRLHLHPIRMTALPCARVTAVIETAGGRILQTRDEPAAGGATSSDYLATKDV